MWKQIIEFGKQIFSLTQKVNQHDIRIERLQEQMTETQEALKALVLVAQQMQAEMRHDRDVAARDRENLILRLENYLLRSERQLPPGRLQDELPPPE